jgi:predicted dehydrogenase
VTAAVGVTVVGAGVMGARWARAVAEHPGARLVSVVDADPGRARALAERFGGAAANDAGAAIADPCVQAVAVCTPEHLHVDPAVTAIEAGRAVAVEKPLAHTVADCERLHALADACDVPLLVGHVLRFDQRYALVHAAIEADEIGAVLAVRCERIGLVSDQDVLRGRTSLALYYGVHEMDIARWYAGDIERVHAERSSGVLAARGYEVDDLCSATLRFTGGAHGTLMLGWSLPVRTSGFGLAGVTVVGEEGVLSIAPGDAGVARFGPARAQALDAFWAPEIHGRLGGAVAREVAHFIDVAAGTAEPLCGAHDGTEAVRASLALEHSAATGVPVAVEGVSMPG